MEPPAPGRPVLAAATPSAEAAPAGSGYETISVIGVGVCAMTAAVAWLALGHGRPSPTERTSRRAQLSGRG